jgi:hypothetical protein
MWFIVCVSIEQCVVCVYVCEKFSIIIIIIGTELKLVVVLLLLVQNWN